LRLLDYNLLVTSSYDLLKYFLIDILDYFKYKNDTRDKETVRNIFSHSYYNECIENLTIFKYDSGSINFSNFEIVISSIFLAAQEINPVFFSNVKEYLNFMMINIENEEYFRALSFLKK
jgi:hypothetical protein